MAALFEPGVSWDDRGVPAGASGARLVLRNLQAAGKGGRARPQRAGETNHTHFSLSPSLSLSLSLFSLSFSLSPSACPPTSPSASPSPSPSPSPCLSPYLSHLCLLATLDHFFFWKNVNGLLFSFCMA